MLMIHCKRFFNFIRKSKYLVNYLLISINDDKMITHWYSVIRSSERNDTVIRFVHYSTLYFKSMINSCTYLINHINTKASVHQQILQVDIYVRILKY